MSIQRYWVEDPGHWLYEDEDGGFVLLEDHQTEIAELTKRLGEGVSILLEWRRVFGEAMHRRANLYQNTDTYINSLAESSIKVFEEDLLQSFEKLTKRRETIELNAARYEKALTEIKNWHIGPGRLSAIGMRETAVEALDARLAQGESK